MINMKKMRSIGLMMAAVMIAGSLAGCGGSTGQTTAAAPAASETAAAAAAETPAANAPAVTPETEAPAGDEALKKYAGTTLYMIAEQQSPNESLKRQLGKFEELTGIKVELEMAPYDDVIQKEILAFESHSGAYDIVAAPYQFLGNMVENEYIQSIEPFMQDESLQIIPGYDPADIIEGMWKASGEWKGQLYGVPSNSCIMFFAYRKDLIENEEEKASFKEKYGYDLEVPKDWDTYRDVAEFFTRKKGEKLAGEELQNDFFGVSMSGKRHGATSCEWMNYMWSFGGGIFDDEGYIAVNNEASVKSLEYYKGLVEFAPPGVTSKTWDEQTTEMQQGISAMAIIFNDCTPAIEDETESKVAGKMGYTKVPVGVKDADHYGAWGFYIPADSQNPEAAYLFMEWFNTPEVQKAISLDGGFPNLTSVYEDPDLENLPYWSGSKEAYEISTTRPRIPQWDEMDEVLRLQLSNCLAGQVSPQEALDTTAAEYEKILEGKLPVDYQ